MRHQETPDANESSGRDASSGKKERKLGNERMRRRRLESRSS